MPLLIEFCFADEHVRFMPAGITVEFHVMRVTARDPFAVCVVSLAPSMIWLLLHPRARLFSAHLFAVY